MPRPRLNLPEHDIAQAYRDGATLAALARQHGVDRTVIRRILTDHGLRDATILTFPGAPPAASTAPAGTVSSEELCNTAGITYRQLDFWTRTNRLRPLPRPDTAGSSTPRYYPRAEVTVAALMRQLLDAGLTLAAAHDSARDLTTTGTTHIAGMPLHLPQPL